MNDYSQFQETADATRFPSRVVNVQKVEVPARSLSGPANLYVRVTGIANFGFDVRVDGGVAARNVGLRLLRSSDGSRSDTVVSTG